MPKVDFHTHSIASPDGGLQPAHYEQALKSGLLDAIAITDHNTADLAIEIQKALGNQIIVGEEIMTRQGEIIGLYLTSSIPANLELQEAIAAIRAQHGLVYVPHPFEVWRKALSPESLTAVSKEVDVIETRNGRAINPRFSKVAEAWTQEHALRGAAGSDAHGWSGWGRTYTVLAAIPTQETLLGLLSQAQLVSDTPGLRGYLYPKLNRLRKRFNRAA
jgi:predicted metal-dependent phosphoesterase TrpH